MKVFSWGRFNNVNSKVVAADNEKTVKDEIKKKNLIAYGNGRSYGDSALNENKIVDMRKLNKILSFDEKNAVAVLEAGLLLKDAIDFFYPKGWFLEVVPGTQLVTLGGMVASNIHGKNHVKAGSFKETVNWIELINANGQTIVCSRLKNKELFDWTFGGMGLTGIVLKVSVKLKKIDTGWIKQETFFLNNLQALINKMDTNTQYEYSVAWVDGLATGSSIGKSILFLGNYAKKRELIKKRFNLFPSPKRKAIFAPQDFSWFLTKKTFLRLLNNFYFLFQKCMKQSRLIDWESFFFPLDSRPDWNKFYGRKGFLQYQCVFPKQSAFKGLTEVLDTVANKSKGSTLTVLKKLGRSGGGFSFPMEGYTITLDFPATSQNLKLLKKLDEIVIKFKGRIYLAKDSRINEKEFKRSDPRVDKFIKLRKKSFDREHVFSSQQSDRLGI